MTNYKYIDPTARKKHIAKAIACGLLAILFIWVLVSSSIFYADGSERYFSGDAQDYYEELCKKGFPSDYAMLLTELHLLHPTWEFEPLLITEAKSTYTWDYVIDKETEEPDTNLISASNSYSAYRHPTNLTLYDSGYYQASRETVEYFMDPRNFLNETDIFQFFDLSNHTTASPESIRAVLNNTFMSDAYLENGESYEAYFYEVGQELGVNPLYLAVKVRQEQGVSGTSPIISGTCGTLLADYYINNTQISASGNQVLAPSSGYDADELRQFNRHYNYFNVGAYGKGLFEIYYNAMKRAATGTADMSEAWGGSAAWNTKWKSIYGGAYSLKYNYIDRYQGTIYLQKFNVDSRAGNRNFWGQYMQNITGAMSEARSLYSAFASIDGLDMPCTFQIPVYGDMPSRISADPANGSCYSLLPANQKYSFEITLSDPEKLSGDSAPIYRTTQAIYGEPLTFSGTVDHSYGLKKLEYRLDDGEWVSLGYTKTLNFSIPTDFLEGSTHILIIRGTAGYDQNDSAKKNNYHFLCGVFYLEAVRPNVELSIQNGASQETYIYKAGTSVELPTCESPDFVGWLDSTDRLLPSGAEIQVDCDLTCEAMFLPFLHLSGAAISIKEEAPSLRFSAVIDQAIFERLNTPQTTRIEFFAQINSPHTQAQTEALQPFHFAGTESWMRADAYTKPLEKGEYTLAFSATFQARVTYSDGTTALLTASGDSSSRTAAEIAEIALQDRTVTYSDEMKSLLQSILTP